jgi:PEP-CTERM motif
MRLFSAACAAIALLSAAPAFAVTTIDFTGATGTYTTYSFGGGTVTNGGTFSAQAVPGGSTGILSEGAPRPEYRVDFAGTSSFVSVDLGDFNADDDLAFLEAFSAGNVSLGFTSLAIAANDSTMHTLTVTAAGIAYAKFGGRPPSVNGSSLYADNISFDLGAVAAVPEPSTWAFMLAGFGIVGATMRRRQKVSVSFA